MTLNKFNFEFNNNGKYQIYCNKLDTKNAVSKAIDTVIYIIKDSIEKNGDAVINMTFYEEKELMGGTYNELFWDKIASSEEHHDKIDEYIAFITDIFENDDNEYWEDDEIQLAEIAAYRFAMNHKRFIPFYTRCLSAWDMSHEVYQGEHIHDIVMKYDWNEEIEDLIIARATCGGQHDAEQLEELEEKILENNEPLENSTFYKKLVLRIDEVCLETTKDWEKYAEYTFPTKRLLEAALHIKEQLIS